MSLPLNPLGAYAPVNTDNLTFAEGSYGNWEVAGDAFFAYTNVTNPTLFEQLPSSIVNITAGPSFILPSLAPLNLKGQKSYTRNQKVPNFQFLLKNQTGAGLSILGGVGWVIDPLTLAMDEDVMILCFVSPSQVEAKIIQTVAPTPPTPVSITASAGLTATPSPITGVGTLTMANTGVTAATYGQADHVPQVTVNARGQITAAAEVVISNTDQAAGTYGSVTQIPVVTVDANKRISSIAPVTLKATDAVAATYGSATAVPSLTVDANGRFTGIVTNVVKATDAGAGTYGTTTLIPSVTVDANGRLTAITTNTLKATDAAAATYGSTTLIPSITVDANGRLTAIATNTLRATDQAAGTYGSAVSIPSLTVDANGRITAIGTFTVDPSSALLSIPNQNWKAGTSSSVGSSGCVVIGHQATASGINAVVIGYNASTGGTGSIAIGQGSYAPGVNTTVVGYQATASAGCTSFGYRAGYNSGSFSAVNNTALGFRAFSGQTASPSGSVNGNTAVGQDALTKINGGSDYNTAVGYQAGANLGGTSSYNTIIGSNAGTQILTAGSNGNTLVGRSCEVQLFDTPCINATSVGYLAKAHRYSNTYGYAAESQANNAHAYGYGVVNATANTTLIGDVTANHRLIATGYIESTTALGASAAQTPGTQTVTFASNPTTLDLTSTLWDTGNPSALVVLASDYIFLGEYPRDNGRVFAISFSLRADVDSTSGISFELMWYNGSTTQNIYQLSDSWTAADHVNVSFSGIQRVPAATAAANYVYVQATRTSGSSNLVVLFYKLSVVRIA